MQTPSKIGPPRSKNPVPPLSTIIKRRQQVGLQYVGLPGIGGRRRDVTAAGRGSDRSMWVTCDRLSRQRLAWRHGNSADWLRPDNGVDMNANCSSTITAAINFLLKHKYKYGFYRHIVKIKGSNETGIGLLQLCFQWRNTHWTRLDKCQWPPGSMGHQAWP